MKKTILIIALLAYNFNIYAQNKNIYYTKDWKVTTKDNAKFYRPSPKKMDNLWLVNDYYINGALQFKGLTKNVEKELWEGDVTWYLPNGKIETKARYKNGNLLGVFTTYEGASGNPKDGYDEKDLYFYDNQVKPVDATSTAIDTYKHYYINTNQIAELYESVVGYDDKTSNTTFFNKNGEIIGKLIYDKYSEKDSGLDILFYEEDCKYSSECKYISIKEKVNYKEGKKVSIKYYDSQEILIADGQYKNEKPYHGTFFEESCYFNKVIEYEQGVIQKETVYTKNYTEIAVATYKNGLIYNGTLFYECNLIKNYKNGKLYGKVIEYINDDIENLNSEFQYKNGLKHGLYKLFSDGNLLEKGTYKNNNLVGEIWYYNAGYDDIEHNPDVLYTNYYALKLELKKRRVEKISMYNEEGEIENEYQLAKNSTDKFIYLSNGFHGFRIYDYNFDGFLDFSINSTYYYEETSTINTYYLFNPETKLYEHCHYLDDKNKISFDKETKTVIEIKNDVYDGDYSYDDDYVEYKTVTTNTITKNGELIKIKEIDTVTTFNNDEVNKTIRQIFPLQINKFPLLNSNLPKIAFIQNGKKQVLEQSNQEIMLKKFPFSITFPLIDNTKIKDAYYNTRITASPDKRLLEKVKVGTRTKKTAFFALGTSMAAIKTNLHVDNEGHNALAYENLEYDRVKIIKRMDNNVILVSFDVNSVKEIALKDYPQDKFLKQPLYLLIFIDKNLNERIETDELNKVKLLFID